MPTINDLRQQAATIKNATQVGENTATRVGTTFETIADLLEGMGGVTNLSAIDIGSIDTLNTTGDMLVGTPNIYTLTKTIGANTFKVGTLFQFANNGRYDVAQVIVSQFIVDADGRIDTTSADQEVHIFYRLCKTMNGGTLPTPIGTWTTWTELGGSGGSGVTIDPYPTQNSGNAVSSGGVFERLQDVAPKVDISAIDDMDEYADMLAGVSPFYAVTKTLSGNVFRIGTLMEFVNQGRYILYQILATDYVLNDDGTLDTTLSENGGLKLIWRMKQFSGNPPAGVTIGVWSAWSYLSGGDSGYQPDNEDIDLNASDQLQFANKLYDASAFSGLGRVYLRKNIVTSGGVEKNVLTQAMVNTANTIYHIQYDYDLNGQTITMQNGCILLFEGGSISNGTLVGNNTQIIAEDKKIFSGVMFSDFSQPFNARWFVSKVNKTVLDATLNDCFAELNYAFNSGITAMHFTNDVYYVSDTIQVAKNVAITGDMFKIETFAAWNDGQRANVLQNDKFKGIFTNTGETIIEYGYNGNLNKELTIEGVNFITDYYYKDDTYDNNIPVVKIRAAAVWGLRINGSVVSMTKAQTPRGTGILLSCYNASGYIADANFMGSVSGFDKCVDTQNNGGWINGLQLLCSLTGYQGCVGNANGVFAKGVFQAAGSKTDNVDAFFELENRFILASLVYDLNSGGRAHYAVKRESEENFTDIATAYNPEYHCIKRGIKKTYKLLDYVLNSSFRKCLESATITSRLYNSDTDEDIPYVLNNIAEFGTLDANVFTSGTNIDMNDGNAFSADVIDFVTFNLNIKTNYNELFIEQLRTYFVYLYREHIGNYQSFKYLDVDIKDNSNRVVLLKQNIELRHYGTEVIDIIQEWMQPYGSNRYTFNLTWHSLTKTTTSVYIGAIGVCNLLGNQPEVTNINVYKDLAVNQIIPKNKNDKSLFYSPNLSRTIGSYNFATIYLGTLTFTSKPTQEAVFLKGYISRHNICYASEFEIQAFKMANANATFRILCGIGSDANDNEIELHYELTETSTTLVYDLYLKTQGPTSRTYITITELRQMNYNNVTFAMLYPATHTGGTTTLIGYFGTSGNNTKTNTLLASASYAPASTWYDKTNKRVLYYAGDVLGWIDSSDGVAASVKRSGTFAQKPSSSDIYVGFRYWCTDKQTAEGATNGIPIWHQGSDVWVDALGRTIS